MQVLSQPHQLAAHTSIITSSGHPVELKGFGCAHFAALQYITRLATDSEFIDPKDSKDKETCKEIRAKYAASLAGPCSHCYCLRCVGT